MRKIDKIILGIYTTIFILSEFVIIGFIINNLLISEIGIIAIFGAFSLFYIGMTVEYEYPHAKIFDRIASDEVRNDPKRWLGLQRTFQRIQYSIFIISFLIATIGLFTQRPQSMEAGLFLMEMFLVPVISFYYFDSARNILGMGYSEIRVKSTYGVKALAKLALDLLNQDEMSGIQYLRKSLKLFNSFLRFKELKCEDAETALSYVTVLCETAKELPFKPLTKLSKSLSEFSSLLDLPADFKEFVNDQEIANVKGFQMSTSQRSSSRALFEKITLLAVILTAIGTALQAFLPEGYKTIVTNFIVASFTTPSVITTILTFIFAIVFLRFLLKMSEGEVRKNEIGKLK